MQLQIKPYEKAAPIEWNFEELKAELAEKVEHYKTLQYTPEQIAAAKTDRAGLNNLKKALTDERIRREKEYMEPFNLFKSQINELVAMIDVPARLIDTQVKEFEEYEKREKRNDCLKLWQNRVDDGNAPGWLTFEQIENEKWQNKTFTLAKVMEEMDEKIARINNEVSLIEALPDCAFEAMEVYKKTLDVGTALAEGKNLAEMAKRKAEAERAKAAVSAQEPEIAPLTPEPIEIRPDEVPAEEKAPAPNKMVLRFEVEIDVKQAAALRDFFMAKGITYRKI